MAGQRSPGAAGSSAIRAGSLSPYRRDRGRGHHLGRLLVFLGRLGGQAFEDKPWAGFLVPLGVTLVISG